MEFSKGSIPATIPVDPVLILAGLQFRLDSF